MQTHDVTYHEFNRCPKCGGWYFGYNATDGFHAVPHVCTPPTPETVVSKPTEAKP